MVYFMSCAWREITALVIMDKFRGAVAIKNNIVNRCTYNFSGAFMCLGQILQWLYFYIK